MDVIAWLYDWVVAGKALGSTLDILAIDAQYPGLLKDLDTFAWQVQLTKQQVEAES